MREKGVIQAIVSTDLELGCALVKGRATSRALIDTRFVVLVVLARAGTFGTLLAQNAEL